jgi:hypothetical protein
MRSKSRAKRSNTELNPLIGDFINTIDQVRRLVGLARLLAISHFCERHACSGNAEHSQASLSPPYRWPQKSFRPIICEAPLGPVWFLAGRAPR